MEKIFEQIPFIQARPGQASAEEIFILLYFHLSIDRYVHMYVCM